MAAPPLTLSLLAAFGCLSGAMSWYAQIRRLFTNIKQEVNMRDVTPGNRKVSVAETIRELKKNGIDVNEEQAKEILDFLYLLGNITVSQYLKDNGNKETDRPEPSD